MRTTVRKTVFKHCKVVLRAQVYWSRTLAFIFPWTRTIIVNYGSWVFSMVEVWILPIDKLALDCKLCSWTITTVRPLRCRRRTLILCPLFSQQDSLIDPLYCKKNGHSTIHSSCSLSFQSCTDIYSGKTIKSPINPVQQEQNYEEKVRRGIWAMLPTKSHAH